MSTAHVAGCVFPGEVWCVCGQHVPTGQWEEHRSSNFEGTHMAGTRLFRDPTETTRKLTVAVPIEMDEQLRRVAARTGKNVGALIRGWIEKQLKETVW